MRKAKNRKLLSPVTLKHMPVLKTKQIFSHMENGIHCFSSVSSPSDIFAHGLGIWSKKNLKRIFKDYSGNYKTNYKSELHDFD